MQLGEESVVQSRQINAKDTLAAGLLVSALSSSTDFVYTHFRSKVGTAQTLSYFLEGWREYYKTSRFLKDLAYLEESLNLWQEFNDKGSIATR